MTQNNKNFNYTYSAPQQAQIDKIVEKYKPATKQDDIASQIKAIDDGVEKSATIKAMTIGIIGALLLGIGMCFTMVWTKFFALGIIVGIVGIAILVFAYPIYKKTVQKNRAKIAHKILELSSKL